MAIRFPDHRRQPPPHYTRGPRPAPTAAPVRADVRAIVHPGAARISPGPAELAPSASEPGTPRRLAFTRRRPPPGTVVVDTEAPTPAAVRAIVHPGAARLVRTRPPDVAASAPEPGVPRPLRFPADRAQPPPALSGRSRPSLDSRRSPP